jgi:serine/threonine-protein kinase ULK/ATG1
MYGASKTHSNLYMFLEYCKDGDLKDRMKKQNEALSEQQALYYF